MVIIHNGKTEIVDSLQDCIALAEKDNNRELQEATEYFINNGSEGSLKDRFETLKDEFESYESATRC